MRKLFLLSMCIAFAANIFAQNTIPNSNVTWTLQNGVLTLEGAEGQSPPYYTPDWYYEPFHDIDPDDVTNEEPGVFLPPWYYSPNRNSIKTVVIGEHVYVDWYGLYKMSNLEKISVGCSGGFVDYKANAASTLTSLEEIEIRNNCGDQCSIFDLNIILLNGTLRVPANMCDMYREHPFWGAFPSIVCSVMIPCPDPLETGQIGNLTWKICPADGWSFNLAISGEGEIPTIYWGTAPWEQYRDQIRNLFIEEGVTSIGDGAFQGHYMLEQVYIPPTVMQIGSMSFAETGLFSVEIPSSVGWISPNAFFGCSRLVEFKVSEENPFFSSDETGMLYNKDKTVLLNYPPGKPDASFEVPNGVVSIGDSAFETCQNLQSVAMSNTVIEIRGNAFFLCFNLNSIAISESVSTIDAWAFEHCYGLVSIEVNEENPHFSSGDGILYNKDKTILYNYPLGKTEQSFTVPQSVQVIGPRAFTNNRYLQSIIFPEGLQRIEAESLNTCHAITSISIPASVSYIGYLPFVLCENLTSIEVSEENADYASIDGILYSRDTTSLIQYPPAKTDVGFAIPQSVTEIQRGAFTLAYSLTTIEVPWEDPLGISSDVFGFMRDSKLNEKTLVVPAGSLEKYQNADVWKNFGTIKVSTSISITTTTLANGTVGAAYSQTLEATGNGTITWSIADGSLPDGLSLNTATGVISGTPTTEGTFNFTVKASNGVDTDATQALTITIVKATLGGTVTISGTTAFGETLTAVTSTLTSTPSVTLGTLSYQWKRGETVIGTNSTYTTVAGDIGQTLTVRVSAANCAGSVTSTPTAAIAKASQAAPSAPTLASKTATSITLNAISGAEYSRNNGANWQNSPTFGGLTPNTSYTFIARIKETATHDASANSAALAVTTDPIPTYAVTVSSAGTGATGSGNYEQGATVTINAGTPPAGQQFSGWTANPSVAFANASSANTTFTMPASAVSVTANFTVIPVVNAQTPTITTHPQGATYMLNEVATPLSVTANVADGGTLSYQWYRNTFNSNSGGTAIGTNSKNYTPLTEAAVTYYYYVVVTNTNNGVNGTKTATAKSNTAAITVNAPTCTVLLISMTNGTVSADKSSATAGETVTLTITPDANYTLNVISVYKTGATGTTVALSGTGNTRTFTMPAYDVTVEATFKDVTGIDNPEAKAFKAYVKDGLLHISGLIAGELWTVYNISGVSVRQGIANGNEAKVLLSVRSVYIVKSDNKTIKVVY